MASQDYETEKVVFRECYDASWDTMEAIRNTFITMIRSLLATDAAIAGAEVKGRIKERLSQFRLKYQTGLEISKTAYAIGDHISDLIRLHIVWFDDSNAKSIIFPWVNDETTLGTYGAKADAYKIFKGMLDDDSPPGDWAALHKAASVSKCFERLDTASIAKPQAAT